MFCSISGNKDRKKYWVLPAVDYPHTVSLAYATHERYEGSAAAAHYSTEGAAGLLAAQIGPVWAPGLRHLGIKGQRLRHAMQKK